MKGRELEADPERIEQLAQECEEENWRFRQFLKELDMEVHELDAVVHRHHEEVASQIDCRTCGNCCREVSPVFSEHDVSRLATGLEVSVPRLIERYLEPDEDENDSFMFCDSPCPMLSDGMCTVYEFRPDDCRSFPHLHGEEFVFHLSQVVENCSVCPIVFHVYERLKDELWNERT